MSIRKGTYAAVLSGALLLQSAMAFAEEDTKQSDPYIDLRWQFSEAFKKNNPENRWKAARNGEGTVMGGLYRQKDDWRSFTGWRVLGKPVEEKTPGLSVNVGMAQSRFKKLDFGQSGTEKGEKNFGFFVKYDF